MKGGNTMSPFRKAERKKARLRLGLSGPAGSGKTYSALQIAFGLGGKIALIDTEHGSGELYAHLGDYDVAGLAPPFTAEKYIQLIHDAEAAGYNVIIIDSLSHAWAGEGGLLDQQGKIADSGKGNSFTAWRTITPMHNALVEAMLQTPAHLIATTRAKTEYVLEKNRDGKDVPRKVGLAPVQRDGMEYEFTIFFDLSANHLASSSKDRTSLYDGRAPFVPTPEIGRDLLEWLEAGADPAEEQRATLGALTARINQVQNLFELRGWWKKHQDEIQALPEILRNQIVEAKEIKKSQFEAKADGNRAQL
jgi:hypothetical protein